MSSTKKPLVIDEEHDLSVEENVDRVKTYFQEHSPDTFFVFAIDIKKLKADREDKSMTLEEHEPALISAGGHRNNLYNLLRNVMASSPQLTDLFAEVIGDHLREGGLAPLLSYRIASRGAEHYKVMGLEDPEDPEDPEEPGVPGAIGQPITKA